MDQTLAMNSLAIGIYLAIHLLLLVYLLIIMVRLVPLIFFSRQPLPYVPINQRAAKMIARLPELATARRIIDLGCGTGSLLAPIAKSHPAAKLVGIDYNATVLRLARWRSRWWRNKPTWILGDMFAHSLQPYDVIVGWWVPDFAKRLLPKLLAECKPDSVIITYMFALPENSALAHHTVACGRELIHVYRKKSEFTS